ncbi:hypothetical protein HMPREF3190_00630 [Umbribacter vaginalis]|nr:hypothetical protein HMPREF3190_00630 [Coriobacteriales bacterium DNF00809]
MRLFFCSFFNTQATCVIISRMCQHRTECRAAAMEVSGGELPGRTHVFEAI